jgi:hypothetical protein
LSKNIIWRRMYNFQLKFEMFIISKSLCIFFSKNISFESFFQRITSETLFSISNSLKIIYEDLDQWNMLARKIMPREHVFSIKNRCLTSDMSIKYCKATSNVLLDYKPLFSNSFVQLQ